MLSTAWKATPYGDAPTNQVGNLSYKKFLAPLSHKTEVMHTTNYFNTFIVVADDCPATVAEVPPQKTERTVADLTHELLKDNPYKYTSDEALFHIHALKNGITAKEMEVERERFFSKGQPCFRSSPLCKRYGWGVHSNSDGRIAIYAVESDEYKKFSDNNTLKIIKAMSSKRMRTVYP
jgi:hypothetical protein